jgi:hypothetical protein
MAEVVKCGFIRDGQILHLLQDRELNALRKDSSLVLELVRRAVRVKADVVSGDFKESFDREILNYGHTFAHGFESVGGYGHWLHGEAVSAGMMCAAQAGQRGRSVLLIDHAEVLGERIRISGGGRCNFTNREVTASNFLSQNPDFCRSSLARFSAQDFIALVQHHGIAWHEKTLGQLFCDDSAQRIIDLLRNECEDGAVQ